MKSVKLIISLLLLWMFGSFCAAVPQPIAANEAFLFSAYAKDYQTIVTHWNIRNGFYLYRDHMHFQVIAPRNAQLGQPLWPTPTHTKNYPGIGKLPVYSGVLDIAIPILNATEKKLTLKVSYQGCSSQGYCYPPITKIIMINLRANFTTLQSLSFNPPVIVTHPKYITHPQTTTTTPSKIEKIFATQNLLIVVLSFFGFGLLLAFTPCVLPMIPILSSIIVGQHNKKSSRSFALSLTYVLGMCATYTAAGLLFGSLGGSLQASLQQPWIIILFTLVFVAMALSLFGLYELQLPQTLQNRLNQLSQKQRQGSFLGAFFMGVISTLILSPCVTPALVGVIGYLSHRGNTLLGGIALFFLALGMGFPLLLIGLFSKKILPRVGRWMLSIKYFLGFIMLGVAVSMVSRLISNVITAYLFAALAVAAGFTLIFIVKTRIGWKRVSSISIGIICCLYGITIFITAKSPQGGRYNPLIVFNHTPKMPPLNFTTIHSLDDLQQELNIAHQRHQQTLVDFYANWCIACKEMDINLFNNPSVIAHLKHFHLVKADVTQNNSSDKNLMQYYDVVAPPTLLFFNTNRDTISGSRIIGTVNANNFIKHLQLLTCSKK